MRNMARSICSVGMRSFIVCFDTGSPAKVTSTVDGRNNAIGEALRQAQGDLERRGRDESRPYIRTKRGQSGLKVLVQHLYPGRSRNQGVAHGTVSTIDSHGARRGDPHVGRGV